MKVDIDDLYSNISETRSNQVYRFGDIINGTPLPGHYKVDVDALLAREEFAGSILRSYCQKVGDIYTKMCWKEKAQIIYPIVYKYMKKHDLPTSRRDELVLHMRLGDAVSTKEHRDSWIHNIHDRIYNKYNMYYKITILTALNYGDHNDRAGNKCYNHSPGMDQWNRSIFKTALESLTSYYSDISIYSHKTPDVDFCYALTAQHFEGDYRGFSKVIMKLRKYRDK